MDLFHDGSHVRLRSRDLGTYLHADSDGEGVCLRRRRASLKQAWAVHLYHDDNTPYVLLHSAAYGRYLAATYTPAPSGCLGSRVVQRNYDQPHQEAIRWQAVTAGSGTGGDIMLRHVGPDFYRYLRANGRYLRWNNNVTVDSFENVSTMMQWVVEPICSRERMPRLPRPVRAPLLGLPVAPSQLIRFVQANGDGIYNEQGWTTFLFRGRSVRYLRNELRTRVGDFNFIMCVRAGRHGRLTPLAVNLPRLGSTIEIVLIMDGTLASDELRHPAFHSW